MQQEPPRIDSHSIGDPARFLSLADLQRGLAALPAAPKDRGRVALIVRRGAEGVRETLDRCHLSPDAGLPGDAWSRRPRSNTNRQITVMQIDVATLIANGQPLTLCGDNLFLDLDLSAENLPLGSQLRVGSAMLEVTPTPHDGCQKFRIRFGAEAIAFTSHPDLRHRNLRGIHMRVLAPGEVAARDLVEVISRGVAGG